MIRCYHKDSDRIVCTTINAHDVIPPQTLWIDILSPSPEEVSTVTSHAGINLPSQEEVWKNQVLNRLYRENGVVYMMAALITKVQSPHPEISPVTFILSKQYAVTIRTISPTSFQLFSQRVMREPQLFNCAADMLEGVFEEVLMRVAHNSEVVINELDHLSHLIFSQDTKNSKDCDMHAALKRLGAVADLNAKINESLHSISRLLHFFYQTEGLSSVVKEGTQALIVDAGVLIQETSFMSEKITFQLDATLGMINLEQNDIIKIFSVVAVFFMPPTLISSLYGMNFHFMPELQWMWGYPYAISMMALSAFIPYLYFKKRGWL